MREAVFRLAYSTWPENVPSFAGTPERLAALYAMRTKESWDTIERPAYGTPEDRLAFSLMMKQQPMTICDRLFPFPELRGEVLGRWCGWCGPGIAEQ